MRFLHVGLDGLAQAHQSTEARIADQSSHDSEVSAKSGFCLCLLSTLKSKKIGNFV